MIQFFPLAMPLALSPYNTRNLTGAGISQDFRAGTRVSRG